MERTIFVKSYISYLIIKLFLLNMINFNEIYIFFKIIIYQSRISVRITLFYIIYYTFLTAFFIVMLQVFFKTLREDRPTWTMEDGGLIGLNWSQLSIENILMSLIIHDHCLNHEWWPDPTLFEMSFHSRIQSGHGLPTHTSREWDWIHSHLVQVRKHYR